jgi:hypothetical protein
MVRNRLSVTPLVQLVEPIRRFWSLVVFWGGKVVRHMAQSGHTFVGFSQRPRRRGYADTCPFSGGIDDAHEADLVSLLAVIHLVYADLVCPDHILAFRSFVVVAPEPLESVLEVSKGVEPVPVDHDAACLNWAARAIG